MIDSDYRRVCSKTDDFDETKPVREKLKNIRQTMGVDVHLTDYDYKAKLNRWRVSLPQFYNFILHSRAGTVKDEFFTRKQQKFEWERATKKGMKTNEQHKKRGKKLYSKKFLVDGKNVQVKVAKGSRCQYIEYKEGSKTVRKPLPKSMRHEERKNPLLYAGRLGMFWLCDQGKL